MAWTAPNTRSSKTCASHLHASVDSLPRYVNVTAHASANNGHKRNGLRHHYLYLTPPTCKNVWGACS